MHETNGYVLLGWSELNALNADGARSRVTAAFYRCDACAATVTCTGPSERALNLSALREHDAALHGGES